MWAWETTACSFLSKQETFFFCQQHQQVKLGIIFPYTNQSSWTPVNLTRHTMHILLLFLAAVCLDINFKISQPCFCVSQVCEGRAGRSAGSITVFKQLQYGRRRRRGTIRELTAHSCSYTQFPVAPENREDFTFKMQPWRQISSAVMHVFLDKRPVMICSICCLESCVGLDELSRHQTICC